MKHPTLWAALAAAVVTLSLPLSLASCRSTALRPGDAVPYPDGYRAWHHVKSMVIQPGHPLHDAFGGIHHVYANPAALAGLSSGQYGAGAVFAFDLLATREGGNAVEEGERKVLGVMHYEPDAFAATGGWGFAGFGPDGRDVVKDMQSQCFACHTARRDHGFVFSQLRP